LARLGWAGVINDLFEQPVKTFRHFLQRLTYQKPFREEQPGPGDALRSETEPRGPLVRFTAARRVNLPHPAYYANAASNRTRRRHRRSAERLPRGSDAAPSVSQPGCGIEQHFVDILGFCRYGPKLRLLSRRLTLRSGGTFMDISDKIIWQQASGDTERDYSELCLKWDVILNGPGYAGPWPDCAKVLSKDGSSSRKITDLRRFSEEMKDGDFVVLRLGTANVLGVGQIVDSYE
jgi:hypothetical protein